MTKRNEPEYYCKSKDGSITYTYDEQFIYATDKEGTRRLDTFDQHYYKLRVFNSIPILEIDGLRMQLVRDFETPLDYAKEVVEGLGIAHGKGQSIVLDTCMGLGYTAIEVAKSPAVAKVVTCEIAQAVITLAKWNPFSDGLLRDGGKMEVWNGSAFDLVRTFEPETFDFIIHDPPRFSHADELYSLEFYRELFRVCKKGGKLFHYVGSVGKARGRDIAHESETKLIEAGFKKIRYEERLQGLYAEK